MNLDLGRKYHKKMTAKAKEMENFINICIITPNNRWANFNQYIGDVCSSNIFDQYIG